MNQFETLIKIYDFIRPVLDIGIITFLLYKAYQLITKTNAIQLIRAAVVVVLSYAVAVILQLRTLLWIFSVIAPGLMMAFAIVFQPELRKVFLKLGQAEWFTFGSRAKHSYVDSVLIAAEMLSKQKRGMLAVFMRRTKLDNILSTGTRLNADLSSSLLVTIFG
ncbi:MAG: diadenylate cyclase, partial [Treponema succinifaciens]